MTATINPQGQIVLPSEAADAVRAQEVAEFSVMISTSGVITLRPKRKHQRTLLEHFQAMQGLEIVRRRDPIPEPPEL